MIEGYDLCRVQLALWGMLIGPLQVIGLLVGYLEAPVVLFSSFQAVGMITARSVQYHELIV